MKWQIQYAKGELNIDNDGVLEKYLSKNTIKVKDEEIKKKLDKLVIKGKENIIVQGQETNIEKNTSDRKFT